MIKELTKSKFKNILVVTLVLGSAAAAAQAKPASIAAEDSNRANSEVAHQEQAITNGMALTLRDFANRAEKDLKTHILIGQDWADRKIQVNPSPGVLDYGQLLTQLKINSFTAYKSSGNIQIIPMREARSSPVPIVEVGKTYFDDEVVTAQITLTKACVETFKPIIRPMLPVEAHLASLDAAQTFVLVDTYKNYLRIKSVIKTAEDQLSAPMDCKSAQ